MAEVRVTHRSGSSYRCLVDVNPTRTRLPDRDLFNLEPVFGRGFGGVGGNHQHIARQVTCIQIGQTCCRQAGEVDLGKPEPAEHRVAQRCMVVERVGTGADPDFDVAVADHVTEKSRINHHALIELEQHVIVAPPHVVHRVAIATAVAFAAIGNTKPAAITTEEGRRPGTGAFVAAECAGLDRHSAVGEGADVAI